MSAPSRMPRAEFIERLAALADRPYRCARTNANPDGPGCWVQEALGVERTTCSNGEVRFYASDLAPAVEGVLRCEVAACVRASDGGSVADRRALVAAMREGPRHCDYRLHHLPFSLCESLSS